MKLVALALVTLSSGTLLAHLGQDRPLAHDTSVRLAGPRAIQVSRASVVDLDLAALPADATLVDAVSTSLAQEGAAVALVVARADGSHEYRTAVARDLSAPDWHVSDPIFVSTGDPYRIVEVHNPGSDALEVTFRRGWPGLAPERMDERIYLDACPGIGPALQPGRSTLLEVTSVQAAR